MGGGGEGLSLTIHHSTSFLSYCVCVCEIEYPDELLYFFSFLCYQDFMRPERRHV